MNDKKKATDLYTAESREENALLLMGRLNAFVAYVKREEYAIDRDVIATMLGFELYDDDKEEAALMRHQYRCDVCGCYLDPGEGRICDECEASIRMRKKSHENIDAYTRESVSGQYEFDFGGKVHEYQFV